MSRYELLVFLHIVAVIIWLGAGFLIAVLVFGAARTGDSAKEAGHHQDVGWLAPRLFIPASFATLISGILVVIDGPWTFDQLWVVMGLVGWTVSFGLGFFYFRPEAERIGSFVAQHGPHHAEVGKRIHRLNVVDRLQLLILFLVVATMVLKPTGDDVGVLVGGAVVLATAVAFGVASVGRGPSAAQGETATPSESAARNLGAPSS